MIDWFIVEDWLKPQLNKELKAIQDKLQMSSLFDRGWGNGYVAVPRGHPWYRRDYNDLHVEASGGMTFSDFGKHLGSCPEHLQNHWVVGFDTGHAWNTSENSDKKMVIAETIELYGRALIAQWQKKKKL
jgi:hypothetical protein